MTLSKEQVVAAIAARAADTKEVEVPEWGGSIRLRRLTVGDMEQAGFMSGAAAGEQTYLAILARAVVDDDGEPVFTEDALESLAAADATITLRLFFEVSKMNGLLAGDVEEMTESFVAAPPDA